MRATGLESSIHYTYRREVYASGQEVFMTQRVARPMKFAAFISIIISVAVIFAACQGAVGKAGDKGEKGDKGDPGTTGTQGTPGINALVATNIPGAIRVNDKPGEVANTVVLGDIPAPFSVAGHFIGGSGDKTFKAKSASTELFYTVAVAADGMVTLTKRVAETAPQEPTTDGAALAMFTVLATDANNINAEKAFTVMRNLAPTVERPTYPEIMNGVGTQDVVNPLDPEDTDNGAANRAALLVRPNLNEYVISLDIDTSVNGNGGDDFKDAEPTLVTVVAESSDVTKATVAVDGQKVIITGIAAAAAADDVTVTITAVDAGGLESDEITATVIVVAAPTAAKDTAFANQSVQQGISVTVNAIPGFFTPADLTYTATSSKMSVATVPETITAELIVTTVNVGETTITVKAADTIGQYATRDFTVTVTTKTS